MKTREVASSLAFALGACGGALEELVLGDPWVPDLLFGVLPDHPHWVTPLKRLRTLEIGYSEEAPDPPKLLHALRTHCPELRNLALALECGYNDAAALFPLGLERLEFTGFSLLPPTLTQLTRLTHLRWCAADDPTGNWRVVAALTLLRTMAVQAEDEDVARLPKEFSALRNLRELSLELDPDCNVAVQWEGLEVGRHALRCVCALKISLSLPDLLHALSHSPLPPSSSPAAPGPPSQPDQAQILRRFPRRVPPAPGGRHNPALPRPVGGELRR
jgi:hypothetical protein